MLFKSNAEDYNLLQEGLSLSIQCGDGFHAQSPAYLFSNENLTAVFNNVNVNGKDVLTVCAGSGDVLFNAKLFGANRVDQFDISLFSKYVYEIKHQAVQKLTFPEFLRFFYNSKGFLNQEAAAKIKPYLSRQADLLLNRAQSSMYHAEWMFGFSDAASIADNYPRTSPVFLSQKNYDSAQKKLTGADQFYSTSLGNLPHKLKQQYDVIYLSNISQYIPNIQDFERGVVKPMSTHLKDNGVIACYQIGGNLLNSWTPDEVRGQFENQGWNTAQKAFDSIYAAKGGKKFSDTLFTLQKVG